MPSEQAVKGSKRVWTAADMARARWANVTPAERSRFARRLVAARKNKTRGKKH